VSDTERAHGKAGTEQGDEGPAIPGEPVHNVPGTSEAAAAGPRKGDHPVRRLYDWVLHWAETPYGVTALFVLAFAESSFFPLPPDPLLLALCLGAAKRSLRFAAVATTASVLGGMAGYAIGALAWGAAEGWFFTYVPGVSPEAFENVRGFYDEYGFAWVFLAGLSPIPYKVFTLASGVFGINFGVFVVASILSRGLRFFLIAGLVYKFGRPIETFIDRHFDKLVVLFSVLLVGGFVAIELLL
jgi:membrane protein YqaA with SNARE-associated domain